MDNLYVFTGKNGFALQEKKTLWIEQFSEKYGSENLTRLFAKDMTTASLIDEASIAPFIAERRLILIEGIPKCTKEEIELLANSIFPTTIVAFIEPSPDKRLSAVKKLLAVAKVEEFTEISGQKLLAWMHAHVSNLGSSLEVDAANTLLDLLGNDQLLLSTEITKLASYRLGEPIRAQDVHLLVVCLGERQVWGLLDCIAQRNTKEAFLYIERLLEQGESPFSVWNILLWMVSNIVSIYAAYNEGITNLGAIVKQTGVSFGAVTSTTPYVRSLSPARFQKIVRLATSRDIDLKTGGIRATAENDCELKSAIDELILTCCS